MIQGYYYLHAENRDLIYKPGSDSIIDIRDSDLCHSAWPIDNEDRSTAWRLLVESLSLGADKKRVFELAEKWHCNDTDAEQYAKYLNLELDIDGTAKTARRPNDKLTYPESPCGFGDTYLEAFADLCQQLGYKGGKMWNAHFEDLIHPSNKEEK